MMLRSLVSVPLIFLFCLNASSQLNWKDFDSAISSVQSTDKLVLISFAGSDWCKPCIKLSREVINTEVFAKYANERFELVLADFPKLKRNQLPEKQKELNEALAKSYNKNGIFPLLVIVDENGKKITELGYQPGGPEKYVTSIEKLIQ